MADTQQAVTDSDTRPALDEERIRIRAYELYEKRNSGPGDPQGDWYAAEAELQAAPEASAK